MDIHSKNVRSFNMSRIKNKNTKPEILIRKLCHKLGLRFRVNQKLFNTRPDIVFKKHKYVIFVNGCFWHKHTCKYGCQWRPITLAIAPMREPCCPQNDSSKTSLLFFFSF